MASIRSGIGENMEDRYLFKAKDCNSIWRAGLLIALQEDRCAIEESDGSKWACDARTLCQCTGLKDKNGKLIWENDIVRDKEGNCYKAFWQNNYYQFSWICVKSDIFQIGTKWDLYIWRSYEIEVIGNTFDNPELLESEKK
jgi:uncharacterized phage protein (TIGR01671 family)